MPITTHDRCPECQKQIYLSVWSVMGKSWWYCTGGRCRFEFIGTLEELRQLLRCPPIRLPYDPREGF
jgi:hypothetical protein